jgi:hypothetical protein
VPTLNPDAPLGRRKKEAPEGPQVGVEDKKGKKKALAEAQSPSSTHESGMDPLEIAYGPTIGTHPDHLTKDDFKVDTDSGQHKPQQDNATNSWRHQPVQENDGTTGEGSGDEEGDMAGQSTDVHYGLDGEEAEESQNVWGR